MPKYKVESKKLADQGYEAISVDGADYRFGLEYDLSDSEAKAVREAQKALEGEEAAPPTSGQ